VEDATKMSGEMTQKIAKANSDTKLEGMTMPFPVEWSNASTTPKEVEIVDKAVVINIDI